ncbi:MAG: DNRLRE domain-containing protein [Polyangiaceae bacterium]
MVDADVSEGNGTWAAGEYPGLWTGPSPYDHWLLARADLSPIPPGSQIVLSTFSVYVGWNDKPSEVRAHAITAPWDEPTVTWQSFGGTASWDPLTIGTFDPSGVGYKSIDITALTQGWYSGAVPNHGLLLEEDPVVNHFYYASESSSAAIRPRFDVCFVAGGPCAGKQEGEVCDDGNLCTTGEVCTSGQCGGGQTVSCTAQDNCHDAGVCDPATGQCTQPVKQDDSPCDDGDACTEMDYCLDGVCSGGNAVICDDGDACTTDSCNPLGGCDATPITCNDDNLCTTDTCDPSAGCQFNPVVCDDGDACTSDTCDPAVGCTAAPVSCDDSLACTADLCAGGSCEHVIGCAPGQPCSPSFCTTPQGQDPQLAWLCQ